MTTHNKKFMNKILKKMKADEKETFIQQLIRTRIWSEEEVKKEWAELEKKQRENAKKHQKKYSKEKEKNKKELLKIPVENRTQEEHLKLAKLFGGVREYLLSMGVFKDVPISDEVRT